MTYRIRVVLADDHECVRIGVRRLLEAAPNIEIAGEAAHTDGLAELLNTHPCDIVVSDIGMPGMQGSSNAVPFLRRLLRAQPHPGVIVLTMISHAHMLSGLLHLGVDGIVHKRDATHSLLDAIDDVVAGHIYLSEQARAALESVDTVTQLRAGSLTPREWEVFQLYVQGNAVHQIAARLQRSSKTISTQKQNAMRKLGLRCEADLIGYARQIGLI